MFSYRNLYVVIALSFLLASCATNVSFRGGELEGMAPEPVRVPALLVKPEGKGPFPAVVLLHTCGSLLPHVTDDWPNYLKSLGYVVLAVDSYTPRGYQRCSEFPIASKWKTAQAADAYGALDYLAGLPYVDRNRIGLMGFSAGAIAINDVIVPWGIRKSGGLNFKAAISLYGYCYRLSGYAKDDIPLMQIAGELDTRYAPSCVAVGKETPMEVHVLEGAYHAFDQPQITSLSTDDGGDPILYNPTATHEAQELTKSFFAKYLGK